MKAMWNNMVIAESDDTVVVEGNHYFPMESARHEYLVSSDTKSHCPWKGEASYYTISVNGAQNADAAWYYPTPKDAAKEITNRLAFWRGVTIVD